jgi:hypothetical protein
MTESRVFLGMAVLLAIVTVLCASTGQWIGVLGSALGAINAISARWFLLKWKPEAATQ